MEYYKRSIWLNSISQKAFTEVFSKVNKIPNNVFKYGECVIIEVTTDSNWNLLFKFTNHAGNKDWTLENIDVHGKTG